MTQKYGGISRSEVRAMMKDGRAVMAGIREEREFRRQLGAQMENRWGVHNQDMDRWDSDVNWCLIAVCVVFAVAMVAMCWPALIG